MFNGNALNESTMAFTSWTCTALFTARHFSHRTGDMCVAWPESPELVGSLVVRFDIEGCPCVLKAPDDQYESRS